MFYIYIALMALESSGEVKNVEVNYYTLDPLK